MYFCSLSTSPVLPTVASQDVLYRGLPENIHVDLLQEWPLRIFTTYLTFTLPLYNSWRLIIFTYGYQEAILKEKKTGLDRQKYEDCSFPGAGKFLPFPGPIFSTNENTAT